MLTFEVFIFCFVLLYQTLGGILKTFLFQWKEKEEGKYFCTCWSPHYGPHFIDQITAIGVVPAPAFPLEFGLYGTGLGFSLS